MALDRPSLDTSNHESQTSLPGTAWPRPGWTWRTWSPRTMTCATRDSTRAPPDSPRGEGMWYGREAVYFAMHQRRQGEEGTGVALRNRAPARGRPKETESPGTPGAVHRAQRRQPGGELRQPDGGALGRPRALRGRRRGTTTWWGVTPEGRLYKLGRNAFNESEFAGAHVLARRPHALRQHPVAGYHPGYYRTLDGLSRDPRSSPCPLLGGRTGKRPARRKRVTSTMAKFPTRYAPDPKACAVARAVGNAGPSGPGDPVRLASPWATSSRISDVDLLVVTDSDPPGQWLVPARQFDRSRKSQSTVRRLGSASTSSK